MKNIFLVVAMIMGTVFSMYSQEKKKAQVSFIYPIGTSGVNSTKHTHNFSLNIIGGINGGLNGMEIGSVFNINTGDVSGTQISGVFNLNNKNCDGVIISGVANIIGANSKGMLISGAFNLTENHTGSMLAPVMNLTKNAKATQVSVLNIASKTLKGMQLGVCNIAKGGSGAQLGIVNISESKDSIVPIGLFNIVKDGYYAFDLDYSDYKTTCFSYKMGTNKFYTIFKIGMGKYNHQDLFVSGFGLGSSISYSDKHKLDLEIISEQVVYKNKWKKNLNLVNSFNINYRFNLFKHFAFKLGPSLRTYITNHKVNEDYNIIDVPYTLFEHEGYSNKISVWLGFNAGVSFIL